MHDAWRSWLYFYGVGGLLFVASLWLVMRARAVEWSLWTDRRLLFVLVAGTLASAGIHAAWIRVATG